MRTGEIILVSIALLSICAVLGTGMDADSVLKYGVSSMQIGSDNDSPMMNIEYQDFQGLTDPYGNATSQANPGSLVAMGDPYNNQEVAKKVVEGI